MPQEPFNRLLPTGAAGGLGHLYESARRHAVPRIVFASSNHAIGFHPHSRVIDADASARLDSFCGIGKAFGEDLSRFYFDRHGIESVCLRIGASFPEPWDRRSLVTWLSHDDLVELVRCSLFTPQDGHTIAFGVSGNRDKWRDNRNAARIRVMRHATVWNGFAPGSTPRRSNRIRPAVPSATRAVFTLKRGSSIEA